MTDYTIATDAGNVIAQVRHADASNHVSYECEECGRPLMRGDVCTDAEGNVYCPDCYRDLEDPGIANDPGQELDEQDVAYTLADLLYGEVIAAEAYDGSESQIQSVTHYEDAGLLTIDKGLVIQLANGQEFQITVKRSR